MTERDSSLQSQNPISQAQNSLEKVHNAVSQALSHPTAKLEEQADQAIRHAKRAVEDASLSHNQPAFEEVETGLRQEIEDLHNGTRS
ncbi:hypothetical protein [Paenibacillus sp. UNC499MF]|uniref:hypothetical protein n=1 Tax=Paenibacillus sp. UNC499MF TaxID=1502751 RepID=UPI00089FBFBD|nr:hypothetical protein [Paenibacillus sp. UNC499MF]SEG29128.1 hypothetical protein SAMN02799616_02480 [Paenibacillus sp. UNC499MF]